MSFPAPSLEGKFGLPNPPPPLRVVLRCLFDSGKMTFLQIFDMHLIIFDIFNSCFDRFSQYLVVYLVPGVKGSQGLALGGRFGLSRGLDPPLGIIMECRVTRLEPKTGCWDIGFLDVP